MKSPTIESHVRVKTGNTIDTNRGRGGSLKGCRGVTISKPAVEGVNGPDDPSGREERVAVALYDAKAPMGIVTIPTRHLESQSRVERVKSFFSGIVFDKLGRIVREDDEAKHDGDETK